jgi:hypothetical protein
MVSSVCVCVMLTARVMEVLTIGLKVVKRVGTDMYYKLIFPCKMRKAGKKKNTVVQ